MARESSNLRALRMTPGDVPGVAAVDAVAFQESGPLQPSLLDREERFREELARPWSHAWVVRDPEGPRVLAYLLAWHVEDEVHVLNLATHPDRRRRGLARMLVSALLDFARSKGASRVFLEVRRSNVAAMRLYRAAGFYVLGIRRRYYSDGEDAVEMALSLDPGTGEVVVRPDEARLDA
jgi:[ribosomal protein S18]-alanine N-acetyltransferase